MLDDRVSRKRRAVPADADDDVRKARLGRLGEIDDLRHIGEVVAAKRDHIRPPALDRAKIGALVFDLQIDQADDMAGLARRSGDEFKTDRFEPQKDLGVCQGPGMDTEYPHYNTPFANRSFATMP